MYLKQIFCCLNRQRKKQKEKLYQKGIEKLEADFDIVRIVKALRTFDVISHLVLEKRHRKLIRFTK